MSKSAVSLAQPSGSPGGGIVLESQGLILRVNEDAVIIFGAKSLDANTLYMGAGSSGDPVTTDQANARFLNFYFENTATSGDNRAIYNRFYISGAGGGGESLRSFTTVKNVAAGTAHGAHLSLSFGESGRITGLGAGMRATLHVPATSTSFGGTVYGAMAELYGDDTGSTLANTTQHAVLGLVNGGSAESQATMLNWLALVGANATNVVTGTVGGTAKGIRFLIDGVVHYLTAGTSCS